MTFNKGPTWSENLEEKKNKQNPDFIWLDGVVTKVLPGSLFIVKLENGREIIAYIAGILKKHYIKILYGDKVNVMISRYDTAQGRICERYITKTTQAPINPKNKRNAAKIVKKKGKRRPKTWKK